MIAKKNSRRKLVIANWKMHGDIVSNETLLNKVMSGVKRFENADYVICPPNPYLFQARELLSNTDIAWGGQNVNQHEKGAFTGAVAAHMLTDLGCTYVLLGHSERRVLFNETNLTAAARFDASVKAGLTPVLCVGETLAEHEAGLTEVIVASQMDAVMATLNDQSFAAAMQVNMVFAYEPVWAVGTGKTATPEQAQAVHAFIRHRIAMRNSEAAAHVRIIYGGSIKADNAKKLFNMPDVDGGLVGGASLSADEFITICKAAN
ncbi:MAG: triose-phosphate isomerase [Methylotenera sp.]|nr:MAG: triose-phosphate isomerase [Methylotenera sp.]